MSNVALYLTVEQAEALRRILGDLDIGSDAQTIATIPDDAFHAVVILNALNDKLDGGEAQ
jgi:hypothetical protein